jgi:hypothetical protein
VGNQRASLEFDQEILGPATDAAYALPGDLSAETALQGPSQPCFAYRQAGNDATSQRSGNTATRGFYLGKFRHGMIPGE